MEKIIIAITGPSGAGKTTLGNRLISMDDFLTPVHTTTREPRNDDEIGFYRYLDHLQFRQKVELNDFLFWSGDSDKVDKKYGNYYGMLNEDYMHLSYHNRLIFFVSYKDIDYLLRLKSEGYNIRLVNLTYQNIDETMRERLLLGERNHTQADIEKRIACAKNYEQEYSKKIESYNILRIYTDLYNSDETYNIVKKKIIR